MRILADTLENGTSTILIAPPDRQQEFESALTDAESALRAISQMAEVFDEGQRQAARDSCAVFAEINASLFGDGPGPESGTGDAAPNLRSVK